MAHALGVQSDRKLEAGRSEAYPPLLLLGTGQKLAQEIDSARRTVIQRLGIWTVQMPNLWTLVAAAALIIAAAHLLVCCGPAWLQSGGSAEGSRARGSEAGAARPVSYLCQPSPRPGKLGPAGGPASGPANDSRLSESVVCAETDSSPRESWAASAAARSSVPAVPALCPQMTVPERSKLQCVLPCLVCRERQSVVVDVRGLPSRGGARLFQARVAEDDLAGSKAGIYLETLGGGELFAFLSTQELWDCPEGREPAMQIMRAHGAKYATFAKNEAGAYTVVGAAGTTMVLSGHFSSHSVLACDAQGQVLAEVSPSSSGDTYEVTVYPNVDSGLIILALLAIDKREWAPPAGQR